MIQALYHSAKTGKMIYRPVLLLVGCSEELQFASKNEDHASLTEEDGMPASEEMNLPEETRLPEGSTMNPDGDIVTRDGVSYERWSCYPS